MRGELLRGEVQFAINGQVSMTAIVELVDEGLGRLSLRQVPVDDPAVIAQVTAFVEQMLPTVSASLGVPVELPTAPPVPPTPTPTPTE